MSVLNKAVKIVNLINTRLLNSWIFSVLCKEMGADDQTLLLHTEIHWLSQSSVLSIFELRHEVQQFLINNKECRYATLFEDEYWLKKLVYLSDTF